MKGLIPVVIFSLLALNVGTAGETQRNFVKLDVVDMTPRFMAFYEDAKRVKSSEERFELWKDRYNFVALPPGLPDRDERARRLLNEAWPHYPDAIERIQSAPESLDPRPILRKVATLLEVGDELPPIRLLYYVGMFEGNAFFAPQQDGTLMVALPVEMETHRLEVSMAHEFFHAIHHFNTGSQLGPEGSVSALVLSEGLAMHATRRLLPDRQTSEHMGGDADWVEHCDEALEAIITGIRNNLADSGPESINRLTVGKGHTGMKREAYCAGWHLVGRLLADGHTFGELARSEDSDGLVRRAILLQQSSDS